MQQQINRKTIVIPSSHGRICDVCGRILSELKRNNFSEDEVFGIHLAIEEALINAVKHGNGADEAKQVKIDYCISTDKFEVNIADEGSGFAPEAVPDPRVGENVFKASGRGLLLMKAYMDQVEYVERGTCVHMIKYKKA